MVEWFYVALRETIKFYILYSAFHAYDFYHLPKPHQFKTNCFTSMPNHNFRHLSKLPKISKLPFTICKPDGGCQSRDCRFTVNLSIQLRFHDRRVAQQSLRPPIPSDNKNTNILLWANTLFTHKTNTFWVNHSSLSQPQSTTNQSLQIHRAFTMTADNFISVYSLMWFFVFSFFVVVAAFCSSNVYSLFAMILPHRLFG